MLELRSTAVIVCMFSGVSSKATAVVQAIVGIIVATAIITIICNVLEV